FVMDSELKYAIFAKYGTSILNSQGASFSFNFNFAKRDVQLLNKIEFYDSEESEDFSDYNSDASWESFDKQAFNELPKLESFIFNQEEYIKAQAELEQEIIVSDENDILPSLIPTGISPPSISTKTPPPIPIEKQSKPI
ncbi:2198_t:CDS:2, partial [Funneliformis caledonium]